MRSVADELRRRTAEQVLAMTPAERVALALALGDDDVDRFAAASGLPRQEALHRLRASRQRGRVASRCARLDEA